LQQHYCKLFFLSDPETTVVESCVAAALLQACFFFSDPETTVAESCVAAALLQACHV
jgi:hypothetical protein